MLKPACWTHNPRCARIAGETFVMNSFCNPLRHCAASKMHMLQSALVACAILAATVAQARTGETETVLYSFEGMGSGDGDTAKGGLVFDAGVNLRRDCRWWGI